MDFEDLAPELKERARSCSSREELAELAEAMGFESSEDELVALAGGDICPRDTGCSPFEIYRPPCTTKSSCPDLFVCPIQSCTELVPIECTELLDQLEDNPCGILRTS